MGSKNKLKRFQENETLPNVIQPNRESLVNESFGYKANWHTYFENN
ncbi:MAG: tRNA (guanosine(46)-N7)-methyltransferase TrmB, partial [Bacteroidota bacterium]|nr:tRNA (guanosine(46)-N7)-methyltransferase TrmB [Bacteroidota bacterium]